MSSFAFVFLLSLAANGPLQGRVPPANSLGRALALHAAFDADRDGKLTGKELKQLAGGLADLDDDHDGRVDRGEFLVHYRGLLVRDGVKPAADLDDAVARVQVQRRARALVPGARVAYVPGAVTSGPKPTSSERIRSPPTAESSPARELERAFAALEQQALAGAPLSAKLASFRRALADSASGARLGSDRETWSREVESMLDALDADQRAGGKRAVACLCALRARLGLAPSPARSVVEPSHSAVPSAPSTPPALGRGLWTGRANALIDELERALDAGFVPECLARCVRKLVRAAPADRARAEAALDELVAAARAGGSVSERVHALRSELGCDR